MSLFYNDDTKEAVIIDPAAKADVISAFLDNVTTVILIMPITFYIAEKLDIKK